MNFWKVSYPVVQPAIRLFVSRIFVALGASLISFGFAEDQAVDLSEALTAFVMWALSYVSEAYL